MKRNAIKANCLFKEYNQEIIKCSFLDRIQSRSDLPEDRVKGKS